MRLRNPGPNPLTLCQFFWTTRYRCFGRQAGSREAGYLPVLSFIYKAGRVLASYQFCLQARHQRPEKKFWQKNFFRHHKDVTITDSGKHEMTESSAERSAELFSKTSEMAPNGLNIPLYEFEDHCVNVIKLIWHNLENKEFLTEFRIICSWIPLTLSSPQFGFQSAVALFCVNLRDIGATLCLRLHKQENTEHSGNFFEKS